MKVLYLGNSLLGTPDGGGGVNCLLGWMVGEIATSLGITGYEYKYEVANGYTLKNHRQLDAGGPDDAETELAAGWPDVFVMQEHIPIRNKVIFASGVTEAGLFHDQMTAGVPSGGRSIYLGVSCGAYDDATSGVVAENFDPPDRDTLRERLVDDHEGTTTWMAGSTWLDVVTDVNAAPARASQPYPLELVNLGYKYQTQLIDAEPLTGFAAVDDMFRDGTHPDTELYYFHALALVAELYGVDVRGATYSFDAPEGGAQAGLPGADLAAELQQVVFAASGVYAPPVAPVASDVAHAGLDRLLDQFRYSTNFRSLVTIYLNQVQALEDAALPLLAERGIDNMTGDRLDGLGTVVSMPRGGRDDDTYRLALKAELAVLQSDGLAEDLIAIAQLLVQMAAADYEVIEYYPKGFYIRPVDHALTVDAALVGTMLDRAAPAATTMSFVYALQADATTFQLSSQGATVETSTSLGLAPTPVYSGFWDFDSGAIVPAGLGAGEFRLNHATLLNATQLFLTQTDGTPVDRETEIQGTVGETVKMVDSGDEIHFYVTAAVDGGTYYTLDIMPLAVTGTITDTNSYSLFYSATGGLLAGVA